eukprot:4757087-Prymnesium_polylepis.1
MPVVCRSWLMARLAAGRRVALAVLARRQPSRRTMRLAGPDYVKLITFHDVWEKGTRHLGRLGQLYYALGGQVDGAAMSKVGPTGCLADRAVEVLGITHHDRY